MFSTDLNVFPLEGVGLWDYAFSVVLFALLCYVAFLSMCKVC